MKPKQECGYSLLELVGTTAIMLALSTVSLPTATSTVDTYKLRNAAHQVAAQCQNARFMAVSANTTHRLHWNGNTLEVQKNAGGSFVRIDSFALSEGVTVATAWSTDPVISARGTVSPSASVILRNHSGKQRTISISAVGVVHEQ